MNWHYKIDKLIQIQWDKPCNNASDAHWRASEIERLEKIKQGLWK